MKRIRLWLYLIVLWGAQTAVAQPPEALGPGLGIILGEPTGFSIKYWIDELTAVDGAMAWSFNRSGSVQVHGDVLYHAPGIFEVTHGRLLPYVGVGLRFKFNDERWKRGRQRTDDRLGIRIPTGLVYHPDRQPVDVFVEVAPVFDLSPYSEWDVTAAMGIRFFFP